MKIYKCNECDKTFNWPKIITECVGAYRITKHMGFALIVGQRK